MSVAGSLVGQSLVFNVAPQKPVLVDDVKQDLRQAKREIELLKTMDPFRAAEMAIEIQVERLRVVEAMTARDAVVQRLADAHVSIRQKVAIIEHLELEKADLKRSLFALKGPCNEEYEEEKTKASSEIDKLQVVIKGLRDEVGLLKEVRSDPGKPLTDPPPRYEEGKVDLMKISSSLQNDITPVQTTSSKIPFKVLLEDSASSDGCAFQANHANSLRPQVSSFSTIPHANALDHTATRDLPTSGEPDPKISARYSILAALPIPAGIPDDALKPLGIPAPFTLHEFLGTTTGSLKNSLANYRVFHQLTTSWCPQREEHGYLLTPVFKCSTNPRVATAHRWTAVDVLARMNKPTECFYNKDGKWYYAGVYKAFRLDELSTTEWEALSNETSQILVKETIAARRNTSPQNFYETSQLYAAGALKVACVGLQCVGFNDVLYRTICTQSGKWRGNAEATSGLGCGTVWNSSAASNADDSGNDGDGTNKYASNNPYGNENFPTRKGTN